jgi:hypothetical protein
MLLIKIRRMRWVERVACMRESERDNKYKILVRKPEGKRSLGTSRHRWEDNIRMDHREIGWKVVDWIHLAQDRDQWQHL